MSELDRIISSEALLVQTEAKFIRTKQAREKLEQRRSDGRLIYENWQGSEDWHQWRIQQLERQGWKCAICHKQMGFGEKTYFANGKFALEPQHPTVEHVLPKSLFPDLTLERDNLVMTCWSCNKKKGINMAIASRMRHRVLEQRINLHD